MTELEQLNESLQLREDIYAAAKGRKDHLTAKLAAEDMARLQNLLLLIEKQKIEESK